MKKKKKIINIAYLIIKIKLNNVFITLSDYNGNVLISKSSGSLGYKGLKKKTSLAVAEVLGIILDQLKKKTLYN
jgi:ribosomal protein S11